jgi:predicted N-acyltransferase
MSAVEVLDTLDAVPAGEWNRLAGDDPFLSYEFLSALHATGCAAAATGWVPRYLVARPGGALLGAMPLYLKTHSYGEYVFDWSWADAYERHGLAYYPKLLAAVPFTPATGSRVLAHDARVREQLVDAALDLARTLRVSSLHCLFPMREEAEQMRERGMLLRTGIQFHWSNRGFATFEDFLGALSHAKRKKIRQERRKVKEAGVSFRWLEGAEIAASEWSFFNRCYRQTYREHGSTPYLNLDFFRRIGASIPHRIVLILAHRGGGPIAASLHLKSGTRLYGRYWGALEFHPALHFETCYYQAIDYCIARGLAVFEGGSRGEHKLARGLAPVETCSAHWLARPEFASAVQEFLSRESRSVDRYVDELNERSPFKRPPVTEATETRGRSEQDPGRP